MLHRKRTNSAGEIENKTTCIVIMILAIRRNSGIEIPAFISAIHYYQLNITVDTLLGFFVVKPTIFYSRRFYLFFVHENCLNLDDFIFRRAVCEAQSYVN